MWLPAYGFTVVAHAFKRPGSESVLFPVDIGHENTLVCLIEILVCFMSFFKFFSFFCVCALDMRH